MGEWLGQVRDFFDWWCNEIQLGIRLQKSVVGRDDNPDICEVHTDSVCADGWGTMAGHNVVVTSAPLGHLTGSATRLDVVVARSHLLTRHLTKQRLPTRQARKMAGLDILAETPFDPSQVHVIFTSDDETGCRYHVAKRSTLEPVANAMRDAGIAVNALRLETSDGMKLADRHSLREIFPLSGRERFRRSISYFAIGLLLATALGTYMHALWRYGAAQKQIEEQIAEAQATAKQSRNQLAIRQAALDQVLRLRDQKKTSPSLVETWAELTKVLPDSTWATDLSMKEGEVTVSGFAKSAASLIEPLEASVLFSSPDFVAPVVRVPGQEAERFVIKAKVARQ